MGALFFGAAICFGAAAIVERRKLNIDSAFRCTVMGFVSLLLFAVTA